MAANVELLDPAKISPNEDNPRLIFRLQELEELEESIASQGILVPVSVYAESRGKYVLLDGERRWRCARKLGLHSVPAIIQPKPKRVQNIMMMFAIHNARRDWDPLPTAMKLQELEFELTKIRGRKLTETELAASASLSRGAVRRYRKILRIPPDLQSMLLRDLEDPSHRRSISVDQVIEAVDAADALQKAEVLSKEDEGDFLNAIVDKFRSNVITSTVEPRKLSAVGRAVRTGAMTAAQVRPAIRRFVSRDTMTIADVLSRTIEDIERRKSVDRAFRTFEEKLLPTLEENPDLLPEFRNRVTELIRRLRALL